MPNNVSISRCVHECANVSGSAHTKWCEHACTVYLLTAHTHSERKGR